jgi:hypothetical protein
MIFIKVDFPLPEGPTIELNEPSLIFRFISNKTCVATPV